MQEAFVRGELQGDLQLLPRPAAAAAAVAAPVAPVAAALALVAPVRRRKASVLQLLLDDAQ